MPALISLACCEDLNAQRQALAALRSLCISPGTPRHRLFLSCVRHVRSVVEFRAVVVRENIMDPLVLMSRTEDVAVLREVAAALNCLSSVEENKLEIADRSMCTVIGLMLSGDILIERHAVCAAANLMEMIELHGRLMEERGVPPLVALASNDDPNSRGEACRCLANMSVNPDMHQVRRSLYDPPSLLLPPHLRVGQVIIKEGALFPLVNALSSDELNCQRYASLCLANLSTTVAAQVKVIQVRCNARPRRSDRGRSPAPCVR